MTKEAISRFWAKVRKRRGKNACWIWIGATLNGYGMLKLQGQRHNIGAHRFSWLIHRGSISNSRIEVCHDCPGGDNRACVNPDHLWLGNHEQNAADMVAKGRAATGSKNGMLTHPESITWRGSNHWCAKHPERIPRGSIRKNTKLTELQVIAILRRYRIEPAPTFSSVARNLGVDPETISLIVKRKTWTHINAD